MLFAIELVEDGLVGKISKHLHGLQYRFQPNEGQGNDIPVAEGICILIAAMFRRRKRMKRGHPITFYLVSLVKLVDENG